MRHLIVFCHLRWDFVLQRPQHLLTRLARHWPVHLVEEPVAGTAAPRLERMTPAPGVEVLNPKAIVYDCMDELSNFKTAPPELREREAALLDAADLVFTGGPSLYEAKRDLHPQVFCLPSAVDAQHFSRERALSDVEAMRCAGELQGAIEQPRLGFFGVIDERLDLDLIDRVAAADPGWQLVMV